MVNSDRDLWRHIVASIAYRGAKVIRNAPDNFSDFRIGESTKTPLEILSHIGDLFDWALSQAKGSELWRASDTLEWNKEVERFFASVELFDNFLASSSTIEVPFENLFQGPLADSLTHIGQIAMLRRLAGSPVLGENYFMADIQAGRVGENQSDPPFEFE